MSATLGALFLRPRFPAALQLQRLSFLGLELLLTLFLLPLSRPCLQPPSTTCLQPFPMPFLGMVPAGMR
eukprot:9574388-Lingulodinium_polyedra.AAC.1